MKIAFQCDPFEGLVPTTDSTLALMAEALQRKAEVYCYTPSSLLWREGVVWSQARSLSLDHGEQAGRVIAKGEAAPLKLAEMDLVWMRQDPPFDMGYLTPTYFLETLPDTTLILNDPGGIRGAPEKLLIMHFPDLIPPTLVTSGLEEAASFLQSYGSVVLKPLYEFGGRSIFHVESLDMLQVQWAHLQTLYPHQPFQCQAFLPAVYEGDKRLFLIEGIYAGGYKKMPKAGEFRSNLAVGGQAQPYHASSRDLKICETIGPLLREMGLLFVGIDIIGDYLTEINVTSPTGLKAYEALYGEKLEKKIWDKVEEKIVKKFSSLQR